MVIPSTVVHPHNTMATSAIATLPNSAIATIIVFLNTLVNFYLSMALPSITALLNNTMVNGHSTTALSNITALLNITALRSISIPMKTTLIFNIRMFILNVSNSFHTMRPRI
jgi:hypothetical protein